MKRFAICIEHNGIEINSDYDEFSKEAENTVIKTIKSAVSGDLSYLQFTNGSKEHYFPKAILTNSIITIKYDTIYGEKPDFDIEKVKETVKEMIKYDGSILFAVKYVKDVTGWGLYESKNYVEKIRKELQ